MRECRECDTELIVGGNWWPSHERHHKYVCNDCLREPNAIHKTRTYTATRRSILALLGNKCVHCGFDDVRVLEIDHINGGGGKEREGDKRQYYIHILHALEGGSQDYQCLCANCNRIKVYENRENVIWRSEDKVDKSPVSCAGGAGSTPVAATTDN